MDKYAFLLELNSNLELKITGNEINGDLGNLTFRISFTPDISLRVHTKAYLFGDYPMKDQVQGAFEKTSCFADYILEDEKIDLYIPHEKLIMDDAFNIAQDILAFSNALNLLGYKSSNSQISVSGAVSTLHGEYYSDTVKDDTDEPKEFYLKSPRMGWGILGAVIATAVSLFLFVVAGITNNWIFFIPIVFVVSFLQVLMYEIFARERICFIGIIVTFVLTLIAMLLGDRLVWTINLIDWFPGATFAQAFAEVPYLVEDEVVSLSDYLRDFIIMLIFFGSVYLLTFANFFVMKLSIGEWFKKNTVLFNN